jgi:hypothetical protein
MVVKEENHRQGSLSGIFLPFNENCSNKLILKINFKKTFQIKFL